jgi:hypothetical protein
MSPEGLLEPMGPSHCARPAPTAGCVSNTPTRSAPSERLCTILILFRRRAFATRQSRSHVRLNRPAGRPWDQSRVPTPIDSLGPDISAMGAIEMRFRIPGLSEFVEILRQMFFTVPVSPRMGAQHCASGFRFRLQIAHSSSLAAAKFGAFQTQLRCQPLRSGDTDPLL